MDRIATVEQPITYTVAGDALADDGDLDLDSANAPESGSTILIETQIMYSASCDVKYLADKDGDRTGEIAETIETELSGAASRPGTASCFSRARGSDCA